MLRRESRAVTLRGQQIGGGAPVSIQSMTNTDTRDSGATLEQIGRLTAAGCEIVRVAVPDAAAAKALPAIVAGSRLPVVADIHFDADLAIAAIEAGVDKVRLNPGNLPEKRLPDVLAALRARPIPVRVGVNSGSLHKDVLAKYGGPTAEAMLESALHQAALLERGGHDQIVMALKGVRLPETVEAYRLAAERTPYPLHIGITHLSPGRLGCVKAAAGIGALLLEGIGDTLRVSMTGDPVGEISIAKEILRAVGLRKEGVELITCPTCGRCRLPLSAMAEEMEKRLSDITTARPLTVALMGCEVNGPGEAKDADVGLAGGKGFGVLFRQGKLIKRYPAEEMLDRLEEEVRRLAAESAE